MKSFRIVTPILAPRHKGNRAHCQVFFIERVTPPLLPKTKSRRKTENNQIFAQTQKHRKYSFRSGWPAPPPPPSSEYPDLFGAGGGGGGDPGATVGGGQMGNSSLFSARAFFSKPLIPSPLILFGGWTLGMKPSRPFEVGKDAGRGARRDGQFGFGDLEAAGIPWARVPHRHHLRRLCPGRTRRRHPPAISSSSLQY